MNSFPYALPKPYGGAGLLLLLPPPATPGVPAGSWRQQQVSMQPAPHASWNPAAPAADGGWPRELEFPAFSFSQLGTRPGRRR